MSDLVPAMHKALNSEEPNTVNPVHSHIKMD